MEGVKNQNACLCGMGGGRSGLEDEQIAWEETKARVFGFLGEGGAKLFSYIFILLRQRTGFDITE